MRMKLEIVYRQLAVALDEADRDEPLADGALDSQGDFGLIGALHQHAASLGFDHRRVVNPNPAGAREGRLLVGIHRSHPKQRIASSEYPENVAEALPRRILRVVKISEAYLAIELVHNAHGRRGRRIDFLARQIEMRIVEHERDVREYADAERRRGDAAGVKPTPPSSQARLERNAQAQPKQDQEGHKPPYEPEERDQFDLGLFHWSGARESSNGQEQSEENNGKKEPQIGGVHRAGSERGEARQKGEADKPIVHGRRQESRQGIDRPEQPEET